MLYWHSTSYRIHQNLTWILSIFQQTLQLQALGGAGNGGLTQTGLPTAAGAAAHLHPTMAGYAPAATAGTASTNAAAAGAMSTTNMLQLQQILAAAAAGGGGGVSLAGHAAGELSY